MMISTRRFLWRPSAVLFGESEASGAPVCFVLLKGKYKCPGSSCDAMLCSILRTWRAEERLLNDSGLRVIPGERQLPVNYDGN
jgi:hypothetical protein